MRTGRTFVALLVIALALAGPAATGAVALETPPPAAPRFADLPADDVLAHLALAEHLRRGQAAANAARDVLGGPAPSAFDDPDLDAHLANALAPLGPAVPPGKIPRSNRDAAALTDLHDALLAHARRRAGDLALDGSRDENLWTSSVSALWTASGRPATPQDHATLTQQGRLMPAAEQRTVAVLVEAMTQAAWLVRAATRDVPGPILSFTVAAFDDRPDPNSSPTRHAHIAGVLHDRYVHQGNLFLAARLTTAAGLAAEDRLHASDARDSWHPASTGPILDPLGVVAIGTNGDDDYSDLGANRTYLTFDPAGNDTYANVNVGGGAFVLTSVAIPPCWVANLCLTAVPAVDAYRTVLASLWADLNGTDLVECGRAVESFVPSCLGAGIFASTGVAIRGPGENATMILNRRGAATSTGGIGVHYSNNPHGHDKYRSTLGTGGSIAISEGNGVALLLDNGGDDSYDLGGFGLTFGSGASLHRDSFGLDHYHLANFGFGSTIHETGYAEFVDEGSAEDIYSGRFPQNVVARNDATWIQKRGTGTDG